MAEKIGKDRIAHKACDVEPAASLKSANSDNVRTNDSHVGIINTPSRYHLPVISKRLGVILIGLLFIAAAVAVLMVVGTPAQREDRKIQAAIMAADSELKLANDAVVRGDPKQALAHAELAVKAAPDYLDALTLAADLSSKQNPVQGQVFYGRALTAFKAQNNFNGGKPNTVQYAAAARLADSAGNKAEALKYYQAVVLNADKTNGYEKDLARQATESIERLK